MVGAVATFVALFAGAISVGAVGAATKEKFPLNIPAPCVPTATYQSDDRPSIISTRLFPIVCAPSSAHTVDIPLSFVVEYNPVDVPTRYSVVSPECRIVAHLHEGPLPEPSGCSSRFPLTGA